MLKAYIGRAGSGKTTKLLKDIIKGIQSGLISDEKTLVVAMGGQELSLLSNNRLIC